VVKGSAKIIWGWVVWKRREEKASNGHKDALGGGGWKQHENQKTADDPASKWF
jgi:hypothetical protein